MTTATLTLTDFLLARIAEDEAAAQYSTAMWASVPSTARVLAECGAKRRIVEWHKNWPVLAETPMEFETETTGTDITAMTIRASRRIMWLTEQEYRDRFGSEPPSSPILLMLAAVYSDHPDYRDEWRP